MDVMMYVTHEVFIHKLHISLVTHLHLFKSNFECSRSTICPIFVPSSTHLRKDRLFQHLAVFSNTVTRNRNCNQTEVTWEVLNEDKFIVKLIT
jgi:hypothetical protein